MVNIVIPMAGLGSRFRIAGYLKSKPFIDVHGRTMIERVIENMMCKEANFILIGRREYLIEESEIIDRISKKYNAKFIWIDHLTEGTACTVLFARKYINNDSPTLIVNSDQIVDVAIQGYIDDCKNRKLDGFILTFVDEEMNPKWSFAKTDINGMIIEVQEKKAISKNATVGIYFFRKGRDFVNSAIDMIIENNRVNNEFYTCPVYNYLIREGKKITIYNINKDEMHGLGTPEDLQKYLLI